MQFKGNVATVIGKDFAATLGKKGTASDITLYNHKIGETVLAFIEPTTYPDKIQSLVTALGIGEIVLLKVTEANAYFAETVVALDLMGMDKGLIIFGPNIQPEMLKSFLAGTVLSKYELVEDQPMIIKEKIAGKVEQKAGDVIVQIDHSFNVKSVGTVVLGVVKRGILRKHDELTIYPGKQKAQIRSIQVHDVDVDEAGVGVRVGLALKNLKPEDVSRGSIISKTEIKTVTEFEANTFVSKYAPRALKEGDQILVESALNYVPGKIVSGSVAQGGEGRIKVKLEKEMPILPDTRILFMDPGQKMPRVLGYGLII